MSVFMSVHRRIIISSKVSLDGNLSKVLPVFSVGKIFLRTYDPASVHKASAIKDWKRLFHYLK